jgi:hypothetical protein
MVSVSPATLPPLSLLLSSSPHAATPSAVTASKQLVLANERVRKLPPLLEMQNWKCLNAATS